MLTLYIKDNCRHSKKAIAALKELDIPYEEKNIKDPTVAYELIEKGGKRQVPFLVDEDPCTTAGRITPCMADNDAMLYDSEDIVRYLEMNYGKKDETDANLNKRLHVIEDSTCEACE